jgi:DNA polymerase-3 subunit alpha
LSDFVSRIDATKVNKKVIESLIKAGALDSLGYSRKAMLTQIEEIVASAGKAQQAKKMAENSLFGGGEEMTHVTVEIEEMGEFAPMQILEFEKETLGFYVSGHPLDEYREELEKIDYTLSSQIDELADGSQALFIGRVEEISEKISKKGNKFGIANIMDLHGNIELMLFSDHLEELRRDFDLEKPIAFKVKIGKDGDFTRMNILKIETLEEARKEKVKVKREKRETPEAENLPPLILSLELISDPSVIEELYCLAERCPGRHPLQIEIRSKLADVVIESRMFVGENIVKEAAALGVRVADYEEAG